MARPTLEQFAAAEQPELFTVKAEQRSDCRGAIKSPR
jgi:hypothetical protein